MYNTALADDAMRKNALDLNDQTGKKTKLSLWLRLERHFRLHDAQRTHDQCDQTAARHDAPVCHFHSKLMQKEPRVGGAWNGTRTMAIVQNQFLFPDQLISVMVALTEANKENGCLQVIKGSHSWPRQSWICRGASGRGHGDGEQCTQTMELVTVNWSPEDALVFHSNLLHRSEANLSDRPSGRSFPATLPKQPGLRGNFHLVENAIELFQTSHFKVGGRISIQRRFLKKENDPALKKQAGEVKLPRSYLITCGTNRLKLSVTNEFVSRMPMPAA